MSRFALPAPGRFRRGFSLVEMIVAISIVMVLAVLLISVGGSLRRGAQGTRCLAQLKNLGVAGLAFVAEHNQSLPPVRMEPPGQPEAGMWYDHLHQYIGRRPGRAGRIEAGKREGNPWVCPAVTAPERRYTYAINWICGFGDNADQVRYVRYGQRAILRTGGIEPLEGALSETAWFADGNTEYFRPIATGKASFLDWPHQGSCNVVFMDGHVESVRDPGLQETPSLFGEERWLRFFGQGL